MADARELVHLLDTGDDVDPVIGGRTYRALSPLGDWALRRPYTVTAVGKPIAVLRVRLLDSKPPIWRRVLVPADVRVGRLHDVIQAAMGWEDRHLHVFTNGMICAGS